jgi:predicted Zn-dependent protease
MAEGNLVAAWVVYVSVMSYALRRRSACIGLPSLLLAVLLATAAAGSWSPKEEERTGKGALSDLMSAVQPWDNAEQLARCQKIADTLSALSPRPEVKYQVKLIETQTSTGVASPGIANAVSLPGGFIVITRGLLDPTAGPDAAFYAVQSDDELAGVLAHEIAHNALYHALRQGERNEKFLYGSLVAALAGLLVGGGATTAFGALGMANYVRIGVLSHYSIEYEVEADTVAVGALVRSPYSPVGLLTFMERLAAEEQSRPQPPLGIEQTHPYPVERVQMLRRSIIAHGVDINRRAVTAWKRAEAIEAVIHGRPAAVLTLWDRTIYTFGADSPSGESPLQRAQVAADRLNDALGRGLQQFDIGTGEADGAWSVTLMGQRMVAVLPGDLEDPVTRPKEAAEAAARELGAALFGDTLSRETRPTP